MSKKVSNLSIYIRILRYMKPYKYKFIIGIFMALLVSIFNGLGLTAFKPIFDVIASGHDQPFQLSMNREDTGLLYRSGYEDRLQKILQKADIHKSNIEYLREIKQEPVEPLSFSEDLKQNISVILLQLNEFFIDYKPVDVLVMVSLAVLPLYLLRLLSMIGTVFFITSSGLQATRDLRHELYAKLTRLPLSHFVKEKTGNLMSRIINDVTFVSNAISHDLRVTLYNSFIVITHVALLTIISYKLVLITMIGVPLLLWPINFFAKKIKNLTTGEQAHLADLNGHLQEVISGIRVIRAFGMERFTESRFENINEDLYQKTFKYRLNHIYGPGLVELTTSFIVVALIIYGGFRITEGEFTSGSFFTFLFTLMVILSPIKQLATWVNILNRSSAAGERIFEIIDMPEDVRETENPVKVEKLKKKIQFKGVNFSYPETDALVLKNISVSVPIGSTLALVGHSGAGKSTFVDLIPRFYDPIGGSILFDGIDIRDISLKELRNKIGVVTQDIFLFNGTIRENIAFGHEEIPIEEIEKAAQLAYADEFISKLPNKYDTVIGERGLMLSGGQRQRISIARALLKNPEILILDEATSALDTHSERLVQKALETLMKNRTTFVIAHRLSTIYKADQIIVFEAGRIKERGTHEQLLKKGGLYKELYSIQFND